MAGSDGPTAKGWGRDSPHRVLEKELRWKFGSQPRLPGGWSTPVGPGWWCPWSRGSGHVLLTPGEDPRRRIFPRTSPSARLMPRRTISGRSHQRWLTLPFMGFLTPLKPDSASCLGFPSPQRPCWGESTEVAEAGGLGNVSRDKLNGRAPWWRAPVGALGCEMDESLSKHRGE